MRIALLFTFFLSFSSCLITATHHSHFARRDLKLRSHPSFDVLTPRQHRIRRDLLDVCINVNINLLADASKLLGLGSTLGSLGLGSTLGSLGLGSDVQLCLCLKDLNIYLDTNVQIQTLIGILGKNNVAALITALINTSPDAQQCTFPPNSHHICTNANPCHYECDSPYIMQGGLCVCEAPYMSCNGVCGMFPNGCGSAVPRLAAARAPPSVNLAQARRTCKPHESVCGIPGQEDTLQFECLDTNSTATSCGGCVTPHPFFARESTRKEQDGVDCTAIPQVQHVGCVNRRCVVQSCQAGWVPNSSGTGCKLDPSSISRGSGMRYARREQPACDASPINPDLQSQLAVLVDLVVNLQGLGLFGGVIGQTNSSSDPAPTSDLSSALNVTTVLGDLIPAIVQITGNILSSPTISSLSGSVGNLLGLGQTAEGLLLQCGCLSNVLGLIQQILQSVLTIQHICGTNPILSPSGPPTMGSGSYTPVPSEMTSPTQTVAPVVASSEPSPSSASGDPETVPIVVGLTDLLNGLGLSSGPSSVTVDGLGNGVDVPVNNLLDGLGVGPLDARQDSVSAAVDASVNLDLSSLLQGVVGLANNLISSLGGGVLSGTALNSSLVSDVIASVGVILASPSVPSLLGNVDGLVASTGTLLHGVDACGCASGLGSALEYILALAEAALELQNWCLSNPITSVPSVVPSLLPGVTSPHAPSVTSLAPHTSGSPTSSSNTIPYHSPTTTLPHPSTTHVDLPSATCTIASGSNGMDVPIIVGLNHLLASLGLVGSTAVVNVDGIGPISSTANNLLDGLGVGPHGVRRRKDGPTAANGFVERHISMDHSTTVSPLSDLHTEVNALIDLVLDLNKAGAALPSTPHTASSSSSTSSNIPAIDSSLVDGILSAVMRVVLSATITDMSHAADVLAVTCLGYLQALDTCGCIQQMHLGSVYDYLVQIVETSLALQNLCHAYTEPTAGGAATNLAASSIPTANPGIVAGATKLLNGLGVPVSAVAEIDGLLDGGLDTFVNNLLDSIGIGPHGVRRLSTS